MEHNNESQEMQAVSIKKDRFLPISILIAAVLIGGALVFVSLYKGGNATTPPGGNGGAKPQTGGMVPTPNGNVMQIGAKDAVLGNGNAPVTIVEYGDYQCPFCGVEFFAKTEPLIIKNYVDTGKVKYVFRDFAFLGAESLAAANAAQCANDQGKMWVYHDALYSAKVTDDQKNGGENDGFFSNAELLKLGQQAGLDMSKFTSCVNNGSDISVINQEKTDAQTFGVNSTPTFFINGTQILGAQPYIQFQQVIEAALAAAK